jgi:hypothetical protein
MSGRSTTDPISRPYDPDLSPLDERMLDSRSGLEILQATLSGELAPIDRLTGIRLIDADHGRAVFALPGPGNDSASGR